MTRTKTTPAPQQKTIVEESATRRLKQAHSKLMELQTEINKADALLTPASTETLPLEELHKVSCQLNHLLVSMDRSLFAAAFYCEDAEFTTRLALDARKHPYTSPVVGAAPRLQINIDKTPF